MPDNDYSSVLMDFNGRSPARERAIASFCKSTGLNLPKDYADFLLLYDGGDGFVGSNYLILWPLDKLRDLNAGYQTDHYISGILLIGSDGCGNGIGFDFRGKKPQVVSAPFVGMDLSNITVRSASFHEFLTGQRLSLDNASRSEPQLRGMEIFEIHPIILGGNPTAPENKVALDRQQHIEAVRYWNRIVSEQRRAKST